MMMYKRGNGIFEHFEHKQGSIFNDDVRKLIGREGREVGWFYCDCLHRVLYHIYIIYTTFYEPKDPPDLFLRWLKNITLCRKHLNKCMNINLYFFQ